MSETINRMTNLEVPMQNIEIINQPTGKFIVLAITHTDRNGSTCEDIGFKAEVQSMDAATKTAKAVLNYTIPVECDRIVQVEILREVKHLVLDHDNSTFGTCMTTEVVGSGIQYDDLIDNILTRKDAA